jgi:hypothetical protein
LRFSRILIFLSVLILGIVPALQAQDQTAPPLQWGAFQVNGSAGVGYRFTDIKGYQPMYLELYDLRKGPRVNEFTLFGHSNGTNPFADEFSLTTSGLGGDPYPAVQLNLSKNKVYDLHVNYRQAYFYWNQNDGVILPTRGTTGLTDNHDWATVRKIGSVDLTLHATNNLRFNFQYYRTSFTGNTQTTFSPDFLGSPGSWGTFARAAAFPLLAPTSDYTNRFTGGFDYTYHDWNFHYNVGYQTFNDTINLNNTTSPELPIDITTSGNTDYILNQASWTDYRRLTTPVSEFSYNGKPKSWLDLRGSYIFYRYSGPATFDQSFNGTTGTTATPYAVSQTGRANVSEPTNIVEQGFTAHVKDWWDVNFDYRFSKFTTTTTSTFTSLFNGAVPVMDPPQPIHDNNDWRDSLNQFDFDMMFTPKSNWVIRPGISYFKSSVGVTENGEIDDARTLDYHTVWPSLAVFYRPTRRLSLRGDIHGYSTSASYTALTPHTDLTSRLVATYRITDKLSLQNELYLVSQKLLAVDFHGKSQANTTMLTYAVSPKYSMFGGFSYDNELATGVIAWQRGVPTPQTIETGDKLRDQALNRIWQGGFEAQPVNHFGIRFAGNYMRTTGLGEESGINPVYGPLTFPYATGTLYYDFPKAGRFSIDLQRTYYIQQIITGNNFSANMLTIRWMRQF